MRARIRAPAKINLRLKVGAREPSGFHGIETTFCALELSDEITLDAGAGEGIALQVEGPDLGPADDNLAVRAARAFLDRAGRPLGIAIRIRKRIPAGGGLGGGSSDAAAVLRALAGLLPGHVDEAGLHEAARSLGSDVPFFLAGHPLALGTGRGDVLAPVPTLPSVPVLLVFPPFPIATVDAYRWLDDDRAMAAPDADPGAEAEGVPPHGSWDDVACHAVNDFEGPVFARFPDLAAARSALAESGARPALLSGSGSTLFGVFPEEGGIAEATSRLRRSFPTFQLVATRTASR